MFRPLAWKTKKKVRNRIRGVRLRKDWVKMLGQKAFDMKKLKLQRLGSMDLLKDAFKVWIFCFYWYGVEI